MDSMNPRIQLDALQNAERKRLDIVEGLTFVNKNKDIQSRWPAWLVNHGHIPRYDDHTVKDKALKLINWVPEDLYMQTSDLEKI